MANGFERIGGIPDIKFQDNFVLNNTISQQHKLGGTLGRVFISAIDITSLNGRSLVFYDAANMGYSAGCDAATTIANSTYDIIGVSDVGSTNDLETAIKNSIEDAISRGLQVIIETYLTYLRLTRTNINNGVLSLTAEDLTGTLFGNNNIEVIGGANSLEGTVFTQQAPFSLGVKGPATLRGRSTTYKVER